IKTLQNVFDQVVIYSTFNSSGDGTGNLEIMAYDGNQRQFQFDRIANPTIHPEVESSVLLSMKQPIELPTHADAMILSDNYNPVDFYDLWLKEKIRKIIIETTDFDILLSQRDARPEWYPDPSQQPVLS
ncbi:MAG: hypothetical protein WA635_07715, partial [Gallionella sp.]